MNGAEELAQAVARFLELPMEEQRARLEAAAANAREISDRFDQALRLDPRDLFLPMTI